MIRYTMPSTLSSIRRWYSRFRPQRTTISASLLHSSTSIAGLLQSFIDFDSPSRGLTVHARILQSGHAPNVNVSIKLLILHLKCGRLWDARNVFDRMPRRTLSAFNYLIAGYFKEGSFDEVLGLVRKLVLCGERPDGFTLSMLLKLSASVGSLGLAMQSHGRCVRLGCEMDVVLASAVVDSYVKNGRLDRARRVFDILPRKDVVSATALIAGYLNQGSFEEAERIFDGLEGKDVVAFNAMIEGYSKTTESAPRSLEMYKEMQQNSYCFRPTISSFVSAIGACSALMDLEFGRQIHAQIIKTDNMAHLKTGSSLVDLYAKCGRIEDARGVFESMPTKNVVSWTSMIDGYGKNGMPHEALELFRSMRSATSVKPNHATFLIALSACNHAGLLSQGQEVFESMERDYSLKPRMEHYACLVDIVGRSGRLEEAYTTIKGIPEEPNSDVWAALLGASRLHGDVAMADIAASEIFKLSRHERPGAYIALSNAFAAAGDWENVCDIRELMRDQGVSKDAGFSFVETDKGSF